MQIQRKKTQKNSHATEDVICKGGWGRGELMVLLAYILETDLANTEKGNRGCTGKSKWRCEERRKRDSGRHVSGIPSLLVTGRQGGRLQAQAVLEGVPLREGDVESRNL